MIPGFSLLAVTWALSHVAIAAEPISPPVSVRLRAPWESPPLILEALEATAAESAEAFHPILDHLTNGTRVAQPLTPVSSAREVHDAAKEALDHLGFLTDPGSRQNWEMSLALHSQSPKIAASWQLARSTGAYDRWKSATRGGVKGACESWVDWYGLVICTEAELHSTLLDFAQPSSNVTVYPFDHLLGPDQSSTSDATAILYGQPLSSNFHALYATLFRETTRKNRDVPLRFVLRWQPPGLQEKADSTQLTSGYVSGFGAALDLKKVDYLVIDDRKLSQVGGAQTQEGRTPLGTNQQQLEDREWLDAQISAHEKVKSPDVTLATEELSALGLKAVHAIVNSQDPTRAFAQLTQDFPLHAAKLARGSIKLDSLLDQELQLLQRTKIRPGTGDIWLNGKSLSITETVPLGLLKLLKSERNFVESVSSSALQLNGEEAIDLLSSPAIGRLQAPEAEHNIIFDASDRIERAAQGTDAAEATAEDGNERHQSNGALVWLNDVEKDPAFAAGFSPSLRSLLRPSYPGQFPRIAKNLWNVVLVIDLADPDVCAFLSQQLIPASQRVALHFGIIPAGLEEDSATSDGSSLVVARLFWHLMDTHGPAAASDFLEHIGMNTAAGQRVSVRAAEKAFTRVVKAAAPGEDTSALAKTVTRSAHPREVAVRNYVQRLRLSLSEQPTGHLLVNGQLFPFMEHTMFQLVLQVIAMQTQLIAKPIYYKQLTDDADVSTYFYDLPDSYSSRSELVFPRTHEQGKPRTKQTKSVDLGQLQSKARTGSADIFTSFLSPGANASVNATVWIVGDLDTEAGSHLVRNSVLAMQDAADFRVGFLHSPNDVPIDASEHAAVMLSTFLAQLISSDRLADLKPSELLGVLDEINPKRSKLFPVGHIDHDSESQVALDAEDTDYATPRYYNEAKMKAWNLPAALEAQKHWQRLKSTIASLGLASGEYAILVNGRLVKVVNPRTVASPDIQTLVRSERSRRIDPVVEGLHAVAQTRLSKMTNHEAANAIAIISAAIATAYHKDESQEGMFTASAGHRTNMIDRLGVQHSRFEVGNRKTARLRFQAVVDPLSELAQRYSALFRLISTLPDAYLEVVLNPVRNITEMPLKRFYRYSAPNRLTFDPETGAEVPATLSFLDMPQDAVLTMGLDAPPAWLTMASEAVYDLDNIRLRDVPPDGRQAGVAAVYDLKHLLIEGHCRDGQDIPRGLQLELQTADGSETLDTIVMANLAYFQFRARPGLYRLKIRDGKSSEIYRMTSVGNLGWNSPGVEITGNDITLDSLDGLTIYPSVEKRPGKEDEELLLDLEGDQMMMAEQREAAGMPKAAKGFFQKAADSVKSAASAVQQSKKQINSNQAEINIFTVASGHLYERMTYIMILSVLRHTKSTVKFWFIENFLSPSFKEFIPHLSREYGFQYELVTYAWPHWLRGQREKQRTIWGYKILFLDVLFPLDLNKVIFVDSDQVVRHDLKELNEVDLKGAPYGFPPMGDDSYDMDGYRFWKRGYWKDFLQGRPYHISALYVVDLVRFRSVAAGDRLRGQYQALSQDPGSLANLDQDLPQTLMFQLPIRTLDKTWLWCETWCSQDWLDQAKTIDLCSNPKTHEAKLDRARRQIPEWTELDEEVQRLAKRVSAEQGGPVVVEKEEGQAVEPSHRPSHDEL